MAGTEGMNPKFASSLEQLIRDSGGRVWIVSGYRSVEEQQSLWDNALAKYGSEDAARQWVAPPGRSNHNKGIAADLGFSDGGLEWTHQNAARYGLYFPMDWEEWHIEPMGSRDGSGDTGGTDQTAVQGSPYTDPPAGMMAVNDPTRNFDLATQLQRVMGFLTDPPVETQQPAKTHPEIYT